jgi:inner membrane protein
MDSVTQIVLGGVIGEKALGQKAGNKAILWGAIIGTLPDLDVFLAPFFTPVDQLFVHRGMSHSLLFCIIMAPLLGILLRRIYQKKGISFVQWTRFSFSILLGSVAIDYLTTYGSSIFWPFSSYRIELSTIAIVDLLFTLPLLIGLVIILISGKHSILRTRIRYGAFFFALGYLILTGFHKIYNHQVFQKQLMEQNLTFQSLRTQPMPLSNFLWMGLAQSEEGFWLGYRSSFQQEAVHFEYIDKNERLIESYRGNKKLERLLDFTKGYYSVEDRDSVLILNDLRFGKIPLQDTSSAVFRFIIDPSGQNLMIRQREPDMTFHKEDLQAYIRMILGVKS